MLFLSPAPPPFPPLSPAPLCRPSVPDIVLQVRLVILAPNMESVGGEGGLDEKVSEILSGAREHGIPLVYSLSM